MSVPKKRKEEVQPSPITNYKDKSKVSAVTYSEAKLLTPVLTAYPWVASNITGNHEITSVIPSLTSWTGERYICPLRLAKLKASTIGEGLHLGSHYTYCDPAKGQKLQNTVPLHGRLKS